MKSLVPLFIFTALCLISCTITQNPLVPDSSLYSFTQTWGKDYLNPDNSIGPGHGDGTSGSDIGAYNNPTRLSISGGCLLVLDAGNFRIQKFGLDGSISAFADQVHANVNILGSKGAVIGRFSKPADLKTDPAGNIFVPDANNFNVQVFSSSGTPLQMIAVTNAGLPTGTNMPGGFMKPMAVCADPWGGLYILDPVKQTVDKFTNSTPNIWTIASGWGSSGSLFNFLFSRGIAMDFDSSRLIVLLPDGFVIIDLQSKSVTGKLLFGYSINRLSSASGLKVVNNRIYVTDGSCIKVFNKNFDFITALGGITGKKKGEFLTPSDIQVSGSILYVADSGNNRLQLFRIK